MGQMIQAESFVSLCASFDLAMNIFESKTCSLCVIESISSLNTHTFPDENISVETPIQSSLDDSSTLRKSLPSFKFFHQRYNEFKSTQVESSTMKNPHYSPELFRRVLLNDFMPLCPLWCSAVGSINTPLSNAEVENNFHIMKRSFPRSKRYTEGDFIGHRYTQTIGDVVETVRKLQFTVDIKYTTLNYINF